MTSAKQEASIVSTHHSEPQSEKQGPGGPADGVRTTSSSRRRLLRGGLAAAPVLMTVASRPVMAQDCTTSSAHTSLGGSRQIVQQSCTGRGPAYWISQNGSKAWPSGYLMQTQGSSSKVATTFGSVFGSAYGYGDLSMLQVLQAGQSSFDKAGLAAHLVAAVLNAEALYTPASVLSVAMAQDIWSDYNSRGYFEPTAGVRWDSAQIIDWLKTTMPLNA
jgi:hypothetical protein